MSYRVRPVYVDIAEVHNSERRFPTGSEDFGRRWGCFREGYGIRVYRRRIAEPDQSVTKLGSSLARNRHVAQAMGNNGALLLNHSFTDIVVLGLKLHVSLVQSGEDGTYIERLTDSDKCVREDRIPQ